MRPRTIIIVLLLIPIGIAALLAVEVVIAMNRDYLRHADFDIDFTAGDGGDEQQPLRLAVLGDSLVEGVGATDQRASLPGQVAIKVAEKSGRAVHVTGFGVSGARIEDVLEQLDRVEETGDEFDAIVVEVGSNDVLGRTSLGNVERDTRAVLERAQELAPIVVLGSAGRLDTPNFLRPLRDVIVWRATQVREVQQDVAGEFDDVAFMNVAEDVSPTYERTPNANSRDDFHPGDAGYEVWARPLAELVVERLPAAATQPAGAGSAG